MSTSEYLIKKSLKYKNSMVDNRLSKKLNVTSLSLIELCDATAKITKMLLALGSENNWIDIKENKGRSIDAGKYRSNWLYLSRTDHDIYNEDSKKAQKSDWFEMYKIGHSQRFFYHIPTTEYKIHRSHIERNAAVAVLSLSGCCDQHAYVLATLLRAILPRGTQINICGLKELSGKNIPHTFVVVGSLSAKNNILLSTLPTNILLTVDAYPIIGGAVVLRDFFLCSGALDKLTLVVDKVYFSDGKDHLIKRISKQKVLLDIIKEQTQEKKGDPIISIERSSMTPFFTHHTLEEQTNYTNMIKRNKYLSEDSSDYENIFSIPIISESYKTPIRCKEAYEYICRNYPHEKFNWCLEYVQEKLKQLVDNDRDPNGDFTQRLNSRW
ncbi:hypothetical protein ACQUW5_13155 [Legionella sp. CNM-1927-20]|uniref:hypothetical protein n=1 Tax=Legionella sp. CNM-1927-20 TaxID=3422221 RepID=UPI00403ABBF3